MRKWFYPAIIIAVVLAVYYNALRNGFVYDDTAQVLDNPWIRDPGHIPDIFLKNTWGFVDFQSNYYRPMMHIFYMLCYGVFGLEPWGFHLLNILMHAGAAVVVYLLAARLLDDFGLASKDRYRLSPLFAGVLFAAHPIHTEAVAWVAGIPDISFALFGLLSFYLYTLSDKGRPFKDRYYIASVASFFIALFCKEPALSLIGIIFVYDYATGGSPYDFTRSIKRLLPFLAVACVYFTFRLSAIPDVAPRNWHSGLGPYQLVINAPVLFADYLRKLILPTNLNAFYVFHPISSLLAPKAALSALVMLLFPLSGYIAFKKNKAAFVGMGILVLPLLPVLYIPALGENVFAERYLYLPSAGFVLIVSALMHRVQMDRARSVLAAALPLVMVAGIYSAATIDRSAVFKDGLSLWSDTVRKSPDAAVPHNNLGSVFMNIPGYEEQATEQFRIATVLKPDYSSAYNNLGAAYRKEGRTGDSIRAFGQAVRLDPKNATFHNNLGVALKAAGDYGAAIKELNAASRLEPSNEVIRKNLEDAVMKQDAKRS